MPIEITAAMRAAPGQATCVSTSRPIRAWSVRLWCRDHARPDDHAIDDAGRIRYQDFSPFFSPFGAVPPVAEATDELPLLVLGTTKLMVRYESPQVLDDVIEATQVLCGYEIVPTSIGPMLITETEETWRNQHAAVVKTERRWTARVERGPLPTGRAPTPRTWEFVHEALYGNPRTSMIRSLSCTFALVEPNGAMALISRPANCGPDVTSASFEVLTAGDLMVAEGNVEINVKTPVGAS